MVGIMRIVAQRYARAWTTYLGLGVTDAMVEQLRQWSSLWNQRAVIGYLRLENIPVDKKLRIMQDAAQRVGLAEMIKPIAQLLAQHKRLWLFGEVLRAYITYYYRAHQIEHIEVESTEELTREESAFIKDWVKRSQGAQQVYIKNNINPSLIAGIRLRGETFLWEHSVRQQLSVLTKLCEDV